MGSSQSSLIITAAVALAGLGLAYALVRPSLRPPPGDTSPSKPGPSTGTSSSKKSKKKKPASRPSVPPAVGGVQGQGEKEKRLPGAMVEDSEATSTTVPEEAPSSNKGKKKKKSKASSTPSGSAPGAPASGGGSTPRPPAPGGAGPLDPDGPWTRVETRRRPSSRSNLSSGALAGLTPDSGAAGRGSGGGTGQSGSDMLMEGSVGDVTTSVTEEDSVTGEGEEREKGEAGVMRSTVERMLPRQRKTAVDDMLEGSTPSVVSVIRVKPSAEERPAAGFSWADYEDVEEAQGGGVAADEADDEGEWGIVKSRNRRSVSNSAFASVSSSTPAPRPSKASETLTKKQRQNARKREAEKSQRTEQEAERQAALAKHKRELENERMREQAKGGGGKGKLSGGMRASVNDKGALVWE